MAYCANCGAQVGDAGGTCPSCGRDSGVGGLVSGQGPTTPVPPEIDGKWNWGAFLLNWIWAIGHRVWIGLLALPLGIIFAIVLGFKGNAWAWQAGQWRSVEDFKATQRAWTIAGVIVAGVGIAFSVAVLVFVFAFVGSAVNESSDFTSVPGTVHDEDANAGAPLFSPDGRFSIQRPAGWTQAAEVINDEAEIQMSNADETLFVIVLIEPRGDFGSSVTLPEYGQLTVDGIASALVNSSVSGPTPFTGVYEGLRHEAAGDIESIRILYLHTVYETPSAFVQVIGFGSPSAIDAGGRAQIDSVATSFTEVTQPG